MTRPSPRLCTAVFAVLLAPVLCLAAADSALERLAPWLVPPLEHAGLRQPLRSLLQFEDGGMVRSAADWGRRKKEIRAQWMAALGAWPEVLTHPRLEVLRETDLPGYTRKRVRVEIAADRFEEGWLSIPKSAGPHPAVLVPFYEPETSIGLGDKEHRDYARKLAERGFVTLAIGSPGGDARKPDPRIYAMMCAALEVKPSQCIYLDDLGINCKPAAAMGMAAIKVTSGDQALQDLGALLALTFTPLGV